MNLENFNNESGAEKIKTPQGSYFIHGLKTWNEKSSIGIRQPEISCSLQLDKKTNPIRPVGYILEIDNGGIVHSFDRDTTSTIDENFQKILKDNSPTLKDYSENDLDKLLQNTKNGSHNEIWVNGLSVDIVGAYVVQKEEEIAGVKKFIKACKDASIEVHTIGI